MSERRLVHATAALERTAMAWERTALGLGAVGLLVVKALPDRPVALVAGVGLLAVATALALVGVPVGHQRARRRILAGSNDWRVPFDPARRIVLLATATALGLASAAALVEGVLRAID